MLSPTWRLYLTGRMAIESAAGLFDETVLPGRLGRLALAFLAMDAQRPVPRDVLADAVWGSTPPSAWDSALKALVSKVRSVLVHSGLDAGAISTVSGCYQLRLPAGSFIDVERCIRALDAAEAAVRRGDTGAAWSEATVAVSIARRPFLAGEDVLWIDDVRARLRSVRVRALDCLTDVWLEQGNAPQALSLASESVGLEPFRESGYRLLMRAHFLAGDRAEALRVYDRCALLLESELGVFPHPATAQLRAELAGTGSYAHATAWARLDRLSLDSPRPT